MNSSTVEVNERNTFVENEGYLFEPTDWDLDIAYELAEILSR